MTAFREIRPDELASRLVSVALPLVRRALEGSRGMQRLRVVDLPHEVMDGLCRELYGSDRFTVRILGEPSTESPWIASPTKLIELRNGLEHPLLVFLPAGLRTAAEDSLDIATFKQLPLEGVTRSAAEQTLAAIMDAAGAEWRGEIERRARGLRRSAALGRLADDAAWLRFVATWAANGGTTEAGGRALYCLGLVPDFAFFSREDEPDGWLARNLAATGALTDGRGPLQARVGQLKIAPGKVQGRLFTYAREWLQAGRREWAAGIALDERWADLELGAWPFDDTGSAEKVRILLDPLPLPRQAADEQTGGVPLLVWDTQATPELKLTFRSIPGPAEAPAWTSYQVHLTRHGEDGPVPVFSTPRYAKPKKKARVTRALRARDLEDLEEGTYFVRVDALAADGTSVTAEAPDGEANPENESDVFLLQIVGPPPPTPEDTRAVFVDSLLDAWFGLRGTAVLSTSRKSKELPQHTAMTGAWTLGINAATPTEACFELSSDSAPGRTIRIPGLLRKLEARALSAPRRCGSLRLELRPGQLAADVTVQDEPGVPEPGPGLDALLQARGALFAGIRAQHEARNPGAPAELTSGVVETTDLIALRGGIEAYATEWVRACEAAIDAPASVGRAETRRVLAELDVVHLRWAKGPTDPGRGALILPLHPLRLLWHLRHAVVRDEVLRSLEDGSADAPDRKGLLLAMGRGITPTNLPLVLFDGRGRPLVQQDHLTPFWTLYLPAEGDDRPWDPNQARATVQRLLGVRRGTTPAGEVAAAALADRLWDYLRRHPYVVQLLVNVFNPGDGDRLADALRLLEKRRRDTGNEAPELRYSIHLFSRTELVDRTGDALEALLDPDRQAAEDDEFAVGTADHMRPKLLIARSTLDDFTRSPEAFRAHVSIVTEQLRPAGRLDRIAELRRGSFVRGLVQETDSRIVTRAGIHGWIRGLRPLATRRADASEQLLASSLSALQRLHAATAGGSGSPDEAPVVALQVGPAELTLLRTIHEISDQVVTIDRNLGLDFFDGRSAGGEFGYLVDFTPDYLQGDGERLLVTMRRADDVMAIVAPAMAALGLSLDRGQEVAVVEALRSISGRIAIRLLGGLTATQEVIGLLLARLLLERAGILDERILVPVDAHLEWFAGEGSSQRADLLVVGVDPLTRTVDVTIVEVKARAHLSTSERGHLYGEMREQAENTRVRLAARFDLDALGKTRADAPLRAKELASVLSFYAARAERFGLLSEGHATGLREFLDSLESGYELVLRTRGVVYAADASGSHVDEDEPDFPVHRFGLDAARQLVLRGPLAPATEESVVDAGALEALPTKLVETMRSFLDVPAPRTRRSNDATVGAGGRSNEPPASRVDADAARGEGPALAQAAPPTTVESSERETGGGPERATTTPAVDVQKGDPSDPSPPVQEQEEASRQTTDEAAPEEPGSAVERAGEAPRVHADILLGASHPTPQFGVLGRFGGAKVALDLTGCNTISLFGVQGFGKSYSLGVIAEMGAQQMPGVNELQAPLATVVFHYHRSDSYAPEYVAAVEPNDKVREVERLAAEFGGTPSGLADVVLLVPEARLEQRRVDYPSIEVRPIHFSSNEIGADGWRFLMGAVGNDSLYVRQLVDIMQSFGAGLTLEDLEKEIEGAGFSKSDLRLARNRLRLAKRFIRDGARIRDLLRPGRTIVVDMRDEWLDKEHALGLFLVLMNTFAQAKVGGRDFNKLMVFDEAHKYITESALIGEVVAMIREMRHWATSVVIASQDPLSVPPAVLALTSVLMLHRITAPEWLKHLRKAIYALDGVQDGAVANLAKGEALVWARSATDPRFTQRPQKIHVRPRVTRHGGGTKTAVDGASIR